MTTITDDELAELITRRLPRLLAERSELKSPLYLIFLESFTDRDEFSRLRQDVLELRTEMHAGFKEVGQRFEQVDQRFEQIDQRFEQVDQRFEQVDQRFEQMNQNMVDGFSRLERQIDRLGQRWGIRSEALFRATMAELLEKSFGVKVERRAIKGEEFDVIISNGDHILVEITTSVKPSILERLERKRSLYAAETGREPARFILAASYISSRRAEALRLAGFEVIEPEETEEA
jgi:hypothetical protein